MLVLPGDGVWLNRLLGETRWHQFSIGLGDFV